jgi:integrase
MRVRTDLKKWLNSVGLPYRSPHKFRHGFAVYALKQAQDIADFKAISMSLIHANMSITDGIYSVLSEQDFNDRIG